MEINRMQDQPQHPNPRPYGPTPYGGATPPVPHKAPKRRGRVIIPVVAAAAALIAGIGIGSAGAGSAETATATRTETVEVAPQACLDALDATERLIHRSIVPAFDIVVDVLDAASRFDAAGIEAGTADLDRITPRTQRMVADYNSAAASCRAASEESD